MSDKEKLEAKLKGIKELKQQYYIGTQEAKEYMDSFSIIDDNPLNIANVVNHELFDPTYSATSKRVIGVSNILSNAHMVMDNEVSHWLSRVASAVREEKCPDDGVNKSNYARFVRELCDKDPIEASDILKTIATGSDFYVFLKPNEAHTRLLSDIFKHANRFKVHTDEGMLEATAPQP